MKHDCDKVREHLFDARRGELSDIDAALLEEEMLGCPECARLATRLWDMLDAAAEAEAEDWLPELAEDGFDDRLFASIEAALDDAEVIRPFPETLPELNDSEDESFDGDDDRTAKVVTPWWWSAAAVAAVVLVGLGVAFWVGAGSDGGAPLPDVAAPTMARAPESTPSVGLLASSDAKYTFEPGAPHRLVLERGVVLVDFLPVDGQEMVAHVGGLDVDVVGTVFYVSASTEEGPSVGVLAGEVQVSSDSGKAVPVKPDQRVTVELRPEPIPQAERQNLTAFVDLERHNMTLKNLRAGRVEPKNDDAPQKVAQAPIEEEAPKAAEDEAPNEAPKETPSNTPKVTSTQVQAPKDSPPRRRAAPAQPPVARRSPKAADKPPVERAPKAQGEPKEVQPKPPAPEPEASGPAGVEPGKSDPPGDNDPQKETKAPPVAPKSLSQQAREAMRRGEHQKAAELYERALSSRGGASRAAASLRLELARLYQTRLGQPARAVGHLRAFLRFHPNDAAAPIARRQLCRLLGSRADSEPLCKIQSP